MNFAAFCECINISRQKVKRKGKNKDPCQREEKVGTLPTHAMGTEQFGHQSQHGVILLELISQLVEGSGWSFPGETNVGV